MAEYVDNGVEAVNVGDQIRIGTNNVGFSPSMCAAVVFKNSGLYEVSRSLNGDYLVITNVTSKRSCGGCKYEQKPDITCLTCSRKCTDHYEKGVQR
jgi:hypothetical protein